MITDIEKQFFETFGIKPRSYLLCTSCWDCIDAQPCEQCHYGKLIEDEYPKITDRILLELICLNNIYLWETHTSTVNELKNVLLNKYIEYVNLMADENEKQEYINQVQSLFKENNNNDR